MLRGALAGYLASLRGRRRVSEAGGAMKDESLSDRRGFMRHLKRDRSLLVEMCPIRTSTDEPAP